MLSVGRVVCALGAAEAAAALGRWERQPFAEAMPSNERLNQALELPELPTLTDFIDVYETPREPPLTADVVWPPPRAAVY